MVARRDRFESSSFEGAFEEALTLGITESRAKKHLVFKEEDVLLTTPAHRLWEAILDKERNKCEKS